MNFQETEHQLSGTWCVYGRCSPGHTLWIPLVNKNYGTPPFWMGGLPGLSIFGVLFAAGFGYFFWVPGSMLSCLSAFLLFLLFAFPASLLFLLFAFPASLLFMLLCFTCFFSFLLLCFPFFSAFVLLCLSTSTTVFYFFFSSVMCFCCSTSCSSSCLYCLFVFFFALFSPVCILNETLKTLGETQRNPEEILIRTDKKPLHEILNEP